MMKTRLTSYISFEDLKMPLGITIVSEAMVQVFKNLINL